MPRPPLPPDRSRAPSPGIDPETPSTTHPIGNPDDPESDRTTPRWCESPQRYTHVTPAATVRSPVPASAPIPPASPASDRNRAAPSIPDTPPNPAGLPG